MYLFHRMVCGISAGVFTLQDVLNKTVLLSMSMAWQLGRAMRRAKLNHSSVLEGIAAQQNGTILIVGKVRTLMWHNISLSRTHQIYNHLRILVIEGKKGFDICCRNPWQKSSVYVYVGERGKERLYACHAFICIYEQ